VHRKIGPGTHVVNDISETTRGDCVTAYDVHLGQVGTPDFQACCERTRDVGQHHLISMTQEDSAAGEKVPTLRIGMNPYGRSDVRTVSNPNQRPRLDRTPKIGVVIAVRKRVSSEKHPARVQG